MKSYPIWVKTTNCNYRTSPAYGFKNDGETDYYIGSSAKNSKHFLTTLVTRRITDDMVVFKFSVDGKIVKIARFTNNNGRAGDFISEESLI